MPELKQTIRFCRSRDGARIAYATMGSGPPLVRVAHFLTHLEFELRTPVWRPWLAEYSRDHTLVRYDQRGCGLSDREAADLSLEAMVADLESVVDAAGLDRFPLVGASQGGAIAIAYAARHPDRVSRLVIHGGYARGVLKRNPTPEQLAEAKVLVDLVRVGWGRENPAYRQVFTSLMIPDSTPEEVASFNELERTSTSPESAARLVAAFGPIDVTSLAPLVRCPALVTHVRADARVPFEEGRLIASLIPGARFVPLDGRNHVLLDRQPAFRQLFAEMRTFLAEGEAASRSKAAFTDLTPREREILELLAHGLDNDAIGARLDLSEKTVRNNVTRIFDKLGVPTRAQAIVKARDAGFAAAPLAAG
jgi:pimeloyl-ACP methyl ester carboxylesterase/DNA-binding CsgD family transcriptional regulator